MFFFLIITGYYDGEEHGRSARGGIVASPEALIEDMTSTKDARLTILTETLDQTLARRPGKVVWGMRNA